MDLLQAHLLRLEEGYGGDYGKYVVRPFDWKIQISSSKWAGWPVGIRAFKIIIDSIQ